MVLVVHEYVMGFVEFGGPDNDLKIQKKRIYYKRELWGKNYPYWSYDSKFYWKRACFQKWCLNDTMKKFMKTHET